MTELQLEVTLWANRTFGNSSVEAKILHEWEELDEALQACIGRGVPEVKEEIADAGLIHLHLASSLHIVLPEASPEFQEAMRAKLEICRSRTWGAPDANGVVRHVKEEATP